MRKINTYTLIFECITITLFLTLGACKQQNKSVNEGMGYTIKPLADTTLVPFAVVHRTTFSSQNWSNGIMEAGQKAVISFQVQGNIVALPIKNGQQVAAGQVLARIDNSSQLQQVAQAKLSYNKALLELEDQLLRLGHSMKDTASLAPATLRMIKLRSGFDDANLQLSKAQYDFRLTTVKAPVSGIVAGMEAHNYSPASEYKNLCTLLDNRLMKVTFTLLESDAGLVHPGMTVKVLPYALSGKTFIGKVSEIEPVIDKSGSMKVRAEVQNPTGKLLDGMNVRVVLESAVAGQLVIPKSAVLARQGRQVVFTIEKGLAIWNYVTTGYENATEYTITEGLSEGQRIITGNNLTIGHQAPVKIQGNNKPGYGSTSN